ncbi:hypothetical protein Cgig2_008743 [Carnegiea gigantea]|uniref:Uncharacterized protein n=1 Tax=Carnegiea gigantea TaxID=171969 RepID=A0A9Q1Q7L2_9CARY|nr:hypothetical protein Cgig2_008743 [Carnegiea gigantea]
MLVIESSIKNGGKVLSRFLCQRYLLGLRTRSLPKSLVGQNLSEQHLINALKFKPQDWTNAAKKNVGTLQAQKKNDMANAQKDNDRANAQKGNCGKCKHDIQQANSEMKKGCENSVGNDGLRGGEKITITRNAINSCENDSLGNEGVKESAKLPVECSVSSLQPISCLLPKMNLGYSFLVRGKDRKLSDIVEVFKATWKRKNDTLNEEDATLYDKIVKESTKNQAMSQFELLEKCFGPQNQDCVICFGDCVKPKDIKGPELSKVDLKAELQQKKSST